MLHRLLFFVFFCVYFFPIPGSCGPSHHHPNNSPPDGHPAVRAARSTIHFHAAYMNINAASPARPSSHPARRPLFLCRSEKSLTQKLSYNMVRKRAGIARNRERERGGIILVVLCACIAYIWGRVHHLARVCQWAGEAFGKMANKNTSTTMPNAK